MNAEPRRGSEALEEPAAACGRCGAVVSQAEIVAVDGETYCKACIRTALRCHAVKAEPRRRRPFAAALLAVVPGFGQVYNGQFRRGVVFAALLLFSFYMAANAWGSIWPQVAMFIWVFSAFDAYSSAVRLNSGERLRDDILGELGAQGNVPVRLLWGLVLIALGLMFLMENILPEWLSFERTWPMLAIAVGIWLLYSCLHEEGRPKGG